MPIPASAVPARPPAASPTAAGSATPVLTSEPDDSRKTILIHVLEDGFTANGQLWYRGQEIEFVVGDPAYEDTKDRNGISWLDFDDSQQYRQWKRRMFGRGPWPGETWQDENSLTAEQARGRKPKAIGPVAAPRR